MPYITKSSRAQYDVAIEKLAVRLPLPYMDAQRKGLNFKSGELNYIVYKLMVRLLSKFDKNYALMQKIIGSVELAVDEFKRRHLHPYEDEMIKNNGDIE